MNKPLIVANWKMNGLKSDAIAIIETLKNYINDQKNLSDIVICPPFTLLFPVQDLVKNSNIKLGAQDTSSKPNGAFTGDISAAMLKDAGCSYVILGHSERRQHHNEQSEQVREKVMQALDNGLIPIVCIGETSEERKAGRALEIIGEQLLASLPQNSKNIIIAYEPVWSIGTGITPKNSDISLVVEFINKVSPNHKIIYGGSVKADNATDILKIQNISGLLVGGASLKPNEFWKIVNSANVSV